MKRDNVIEFESRRRLRDAAVRSVQLATDHSERAANLLDALRRTKRVLKNDQVILVGNLGQLIDRFRAQEPKRSCCRGSSCRPTGRSGSATFVSQTRIRLSFDRYAASGGTFAGIIDRLVDEKVRKGFDHTQAMIETVYGALKGTAFRRPSPVSVYLKVVDDSDAAYFVRAMEKVFERLSQEADLAEHFELVSKYPIYPRDIFSCSLELKADMKPNDLYDWDGSLDEYEFRKLDTFGGRPSA